MAVRITPSDYVTSKKDRKTTDRLWERFNTGLLRENELNDSYAKMLVTDWGRCKSAGVDPTTRKAEVLSGDELAVLAERRACLLATASNALNRVGNVLTGVPGILIFTDEEGTILHIVGDPGVREEAAALSNLVEGGRWAESSAGTNGIGTAIERRAPVHIFASEHFCEGWHTWTCAGAPIMNPFGKEVLGVVDFTTKETDFRASAVALSYSVSANIASELRVQIEMERLRLAHQYAVYRARFPSDGVLVYDRLGQLVRHSPGVDPAQYSFFRQGLTVFSEPPKEVQAVRVPESATPIGTLIVIPKPGWGPKLIAGGVPRAQRVVSCGAFTTADETVKRILKRIDRVAPTHLSILLIGETGTGKELLANHIHRQSERRQGPFVAVNCGTINKELFESKFFGYERGGFTGADPKGRKGFFECANNGTLFLDEIGELPLDVQTGLLRVLETGMFRRIGSDRELQANCRIIAATNRPLLDAVEQRSFRSDLYYRLSVAKATIPPLRDRREDIPILIAQIAEAFCAKYNLPEKRFTSEAIRVLTEHDWPGNVRELRNVVEAALVYSEDPIALADLPGELVEDQRHQQPTVSKTPGAERQSAPRSPLVADLTLREQERTLILSALRRYKKITLAAQSLGVSRSTLYRRLDEFGIDPKTGGTC